MFVVVICTLILLNFDGYALAAGQIIFLNGTIPIEYVTDAVGGKHFMVFYNRFLKNKYENVTLKDSTSLAECRYQAIVRDYKIASMATDSYGNVECRISNQNIQDDIILELNTGAISYIEEKQDQYWPHDDGIFYWYENRKINWFNARNLCGPTEADRVTKTLPMTKGISDSRMKALKDIAGKLHQEKIFIGAFRENTMNADFTWYDTLTTSSMQPAINPRAWYLRWGVHMTKNGAFEAYTAMTTLRNPLCLINIFELPW